ncbi:MAG TPA: hypothetical protein VF597_00760 [Candidatus Saccharimonadales bacterium]|jgi:hypothetical protein
MQDQTQPPISSPDPIGTGPVEPSPTRKPFKWQYVFIVLGILQAACVALFLAAVLYASLLQDSGVSGLEYLIILLFLTLVPIAGAVAVINLVGLPLYMRHHKPHGRGLVLSILSLAISLMLVLYGAYHIYVTLTYTDELSETSEPRDDPSQDLVAANTESEITKQEAIELLQNCQLTDFYYTDQTTKNEGQWGELSTTGVVLTELEGEPDRISIADRLIPELVPIARAAQKNCDGSPQFWHDGAYEEYID